MSATPSSNFNHGFPTPGPQQPTGQEVMDQVFFLSGSEWERVRAEETFDYVVIGSGFCALGFVSRALENNPHARILVIERGAPFLLEHFQNMPLPYQRTLGGLSETFPWTLSQRTHNSEGSIKWQHGMNPFFGGRSLMWSAWCPRPTREEMKGWPEPVIDAAHRYFEPAEKLMHVVPADQIGKRGPSPSRGERPVYGVMQEALLRRLRDQLGRIDSATRAISAPLAVGAPELAHIDFYKFSVPGPFLSLVGQQRELARRGQGARLRIVTNCVVTRILEQEGIPTALETTRGVVNVANGKIILAMGTLPATTLVLNSFPQARNAGKRFTAHFISAIVARVRREDFLFHDSLAPLELGALYVAGVDGKSGGQYHIQLTAMADTDPDRHEPTAARYMPDVVAMASKAQLLGSEEHLVFVCAVLGELDYRNEHNWFRKVEGAEPTTNVMLQVLENENDRAVWDTMDEGVFQTLERVLSPKGRAGVEYWHEPFEGPGGWKPERPPRHQIRVPALVHEGSTLWMGEDEEAVVGLDYRLKGVRNVYVTGGALWPTGASWNPTMPMVGLSQHLADLLTLRSK